MPCRAASRRGYRPLQRPRMSWSGAPHELPDAGGNLTPFAKMASDLAFCGAGGNRTPVHQSVNGPATTIPDLEPDASSLAGQLPVTSGGPRIVFPNCQRSFSPSVVFPTVIPHFCCRAVMDWPRAALLLTMTLHSPEDQAARANCSLAILWFAPFNESEQLGSQTRPSDLTSKPVSPLNGMSLPG